MTHLFISVKCDVPTYACHHLASTTTTTTATSSASNSKRNSSCTSVSLSRAPSSSLHHNNSTLTSGVVAPIYSQQPLYQTTQHHSQQQHQCSLFPPASSQKQPNSSSAAFFLSDRQSTQHRGLPFTQQQHQSQSHSTATRNQQSCSFLAPFPSLSSSSSCSSAMICDDVRSSHHNHGGASATLFQQKNDGEVPLHVVLVASPAHQSNNNTGHAAFGRSTANNNSNNRSNTSTTVCGCVVDSVTVRDLSSSLDNGASGWPSGHCCLSCLALNLDELSRRLSNERSGDKEHAEQHQPDGVKMGNFCNCSSSSSSSSSDRCTEHKSSQKSIFLMPEDDSTNDSNRNNNNKKHSNLCLFSASADNKNNASNAAMQRNDLSFVASACGDSRFWGRVLSAMSVAMQQVTSPSRRSSHHGICMAAGGDHWATAHSVSSSHSSSSSSSSDSPPPLAPAAAERFLAVAGSVLAHAPLQLIGMETATASAQARPSSHSQPQQPTSSLWRQLASSFDALTDAANALTQRSMQHRPARNHNSNSIVNSAKTTTVTGATLAGCAVSFCAHSWIRICRIMCSSGALGTSSSKNNNSHPFASAESCAAFATLCATKLRATIRQQRSGGSIIRNLLRNVVSRNVEAILLRDIFCPSVRCRDLLEPLLSSIDRLSNINNTRRQNQQHQHRVAQPHILSPRRYHRSGSCIIVDEQDGENTTTTLLDSQATQDDDDDGGDNNNNNYNGNNQRMAKSSLSSSSSSSVSLLHELQKEAEQAALRFWQAVLQDQQHGQQHLLLTLALELSSVVEGIEDVNNSNTSNNDILLFASQNQQHRWVFCCLLNLMKLMLLHHRSNAAGGGGGGAMTLSSLARVAASQLSASSLRASFFPTIELAVPSSALDYNHVAQRAPSVSTIIALDCLLFCSKIQQQQKLLLPTSAPTNGGGDDDELCRLLPDSLLASCSELLPPLLLSIGDCHAAGGGGRMGRGHAEPPSDVADEPFQLALFDSLVSLLFGSSAPGGGTRGLVVLHLQQRMMAAMNPGAQSSSSSSSSSHLGRFLLATDFLFSAATTLATASRHVGVSTAGAAPPLFQRKLARTVQQLQLQQQPEQMTQLACSTDGDAEQNKQLPTEQLALLAQLMKSSSAHALSCAIEALHQFVLAVGETIATDKSSCSDNFQLGSTQSCLLSNHVATALRLVVNDARGEGDHEDGMNLCRRNNNNSNNISSSSSSEQQEQQEQLAILIQKCLAVQEQYGNGHQQQHQQLFLDVASLWAGPSPLLAQLLCSTLLQQEHKAKSRIQSATSIVDLSLTILLQQQRRSTNTKNNTKSLLSTTNNSNRNFTQNGKRNKKKQSVAEPAAQSASTCSQQVLHVPTATMSHVLDASLRCLTSLASPTARINDEEDGAGSLSSSPLCLSLSQLLLSIWNSLERVAGIASATSIDKQKQQQEQLLLSTTALAHLVDVYLKIAATPAPLPLSYSDAALHGRVGDAFCHSPSSLFALQSNDNNANNVTNNNNIGNPAQQSGAIFLRVLRVWHHVCRRNIDDNHSNDGANSPHAAAAAAAADACIADPNNATSHFHSWRSDGGESLRDVFSSAFTRFWSIHQQQQDDQAAAATSHLAPFLFFYPHQQQQQHQQRGQLEDSESDSDVLFRDLCCAIEFSFDPTRLLMLLAARKNNSSNRVRIAGNNHESSSVTILEQQSAKRMMVGAATTRAAAAAATLMTPMLLFSCGDGAGGSTSGGDGCDQEGDDHEDGASSIGGAVAAASMFFSPAVNCGGAATRQQQQQQHPGHQGNTRIVIPNTAASMQKQHRHQQHFVQSTSGLLPWQTPTIANNYDAFKTCERGADERVFLFQQQQQQQLSLFTELRCDAIHLSATLLFVDGGSGTRFLQLVAALLRSNNELCPFKEDASFVHSSIGCDDVALVVAALCIGAVSEQLQKRDVMMRNETSYATKNNTNINSIDYFSHHHHQRALLVRHELSPSLQLLECMKQLRAVSSRSACTELPSYLGVSFRHSVLLPLMHSCPALIVENTALLHWAVRLFFAASHRRAISTDEQQQQFNLISEKVTDLVFSDDLNRNSNNSSTGLPSPTAHVILRLLCGHADFEEMQSLALAAIALDKNRKSNNSGRGSNEARDSGGALFMARLLGELCEAASSSVDTSAPTTTMIVMIPLLICSATFAAGNNKREDEDDAEVDDDFLHVLLMHAAEQILPARGCGSGGGGGDDANIKAAVCSVIVRLAIRDKREHHERLCSSEFAKLKRFAEITRKIVLSCASASSSNRAGSRAAVSLCNMLLVQMIDVREKETVWHDRNNSNDDHTQHQSLEQIQRAQNLRFFFSSFTEWISCSTLFQQQQQPKNDDERLKLLQFKLLRHMWLRARETDRGAIAASGTAAASLYEPLDQDIQALLRQTLLRQRENERELDLLRYLLSSSGCGVLMESSLCEIIVRSFENADPQFGKATLVYSLLQEDDDGDDDDQEEKFPQQQQQQQQYREGGQKHRSISRMLLEHVRKTMAAADFEMLMQFC